MSSRKQALNRLMGTSISSQLQSGERHSIIHHP
jgi:hypothetical protein